VDTLAGHDHLRGRQHYPRETENVLQIHPKIADVAVIGVPNAEYGEEVRAGVQPERGVHPSAQLAQELQDFCRSRLSPIKCARTIDFVDQLPRQENGKLYKRLLKERYWAGHRTSII
jgi:fatty-acyl-CoA synthase